MDNLRLGGKFPSLYATLLVASNPTPLINYSALSNNKGYVADAKLEGLALDVDNDSLYYCQSSKSANGTAGLIGKMSLNGENHRIVVSEPGGTPRSIVLDKVNR